MDRVVLIGRLTKGPEMKYSQGERSMAIAGCALTADRKGHRNRDGSAKQQATDLINCVAFDHAAEFAEKYFRQGMRVLVSGRIQTSSYVNKEGQEVYITEVILDDQEFADSKGASSSGDQPQDRPASDSPLGDEFMNIPDGVGDDSLPSN